MKFSEIVDSIASELNDVEEAIQANFHSDVVLIPDVSDYLIGSGGKRIRADALGARRQGVRL